MQSTKLVFNKVKRRKIASKVSEILAEVHLGHDVQDVYLDFCPDTCDGPGTVCDVLFTGCSESSTVNISDVASSGIDPAVLSINVNESYDKDFFEVDDYHDNVEWEPRRLSEMSFIDECYDSDNSDTLFDKLANWATTYNISLAALSCLLAILHSFIPSLPKDARTLLRTRREIMLRKVAGGEYYYFGLQYWIKTLLESNVLLPDTKNLTLHVNIDGIPLFNSSTVSLWPILGSFVEVQSRPFPIAVYCSEKKPTSLSEYLNDFITEMKSLLLNGLEVCCNGVTFACQLTLGAVICDAPARSFIKCVKGHGGYNCCERCIQHGEWCSKVILPDMAAPLRSDDSFKNQDDPSHHTDTSPFTELGIGLVSCFPLDYMHLVCLGVVRRIIHLWMHGPLKTRLSQNLLAAISEKLVAIRQYIPSEFSRTPRSLSEYKQWKATELRMFLIYTGPVVLQGLIPSQLYDNFLTLSVAIRLLLSPKLVHYYVDYSKELLLNFVESFSDIYGQNQLVYNVHSLLHLADDAKQFGSLDNVSSFKYESYLGQLKNLVHRPQSPCSQLVRRVLEGRTRTCAYDPIGQVKGFRKQHFDGPVMVSMGCYNQYREFHGGICVISTMFGDNCYEVDGKVGLVRNILKETSSASGYALFEEFCTVESFFTSPLTSADLSILFVDKLSGVRKVLPLLRFESKCFILPFKQGFVISPQMHY